MTKKTEDNFASKNIKDYWCSYSLQQLAPGKFAEVVRNILKGKYKLLASRESPDRSQKSFRE